MRDPSPKSGHPVQGPSLGRTQWHQTLETSKTYAWWCQRAVGNWGSEGSYTNTSSLSSKAESAARRVPGSYKIEIHWLIWGHGRDLAEFSLKMIFLVSAIKNKNNSLHLAVAARFYRVGTFLTYQCVCCGHDLATQLAGPGPAQPTCMPTIIAQSQQEGTCSPQRGHPWNT